MSVVPVGNNHGSLARSDQRAIQRIDSQTAVVLSRMGAEIAKHQELVRGVTAVAVTAMQDVGMVSAAEVAIVQAVPNASGRIAHIADMHGLAVAGVVMDAARALGRLA